MKKENKKAVQPKALNENDLENVAGGYVKRNADGSRTLYRDYTNQEIGTFKDVRTLASVARCFGTSTKDNDRYRR